MMATQLKNLKLTELSCVDAGANQHARVTILKRDENPLLPAEGSTKKHFDPPAARVVFSQRPRRPATAAENAEHLRAARVMEAYAERKRGPEYAPFPADAFDNLGKRTKLSAFDEAVDSVQQADRSSRCAAMTTARRLFPELYAAHQIGGAPVTKTADVLKSTEQAFQVRVREIQKRDGCSALDAYTRAGREFPAEREAFARGV